MLINNITQHRSNEPLPSGTSQILRQNIKKIGKKFTTSGWFYYLQNINKCLSKKRNSSNTILKECRFGNQTEVMEKYYGQQGKKEIGDLVQCYKYYNQISMTFDHTFFKPMHFYREKKKLLEYKKLKGVLNFSKETFESSNERDKKEGVAKQPYLSLLSKIIFTPNDNQESILIEKLKTKLQKELGPNRHRTIQDLDKNYKFQKKITEPTMSSVDKQAFKGESKYKEYMNGVTSEKGPKMKKKRNNSCQSQFLTTRKEVRSKKTSRKGHQKSITAIYSPSNSVFQLKECNKTLHSSKNKNKSPLGKFGFTLSNLSKVQRKNKTSEVIKEKISEIKHNIQQEKQKMKKIMGPLIGTTKCPTAHYSSKHSIKITYN